METSFQSKSVHVYTDVPICEFMKLVNFFHAFFQPVCRKIGGAEPITVCIKPVTYLCIRSMCQLSHWIKERMGQLTQKGIQLIED